MSTPETQLRVLLDKVRQGDPQARSDLVTLYRPMVRRFLSRHLDKIVRSIQRLYDLNDAEQSFWLSISPHLFAEEFLKDLETSPEYLLTFLLAKTHDKVVEIQRRYLHCPKRDLRRQQGLELLPPLSEATGQEPDPIENAIAHETWDRILARTQPGSILREVLLLLRDGHGVTGVAERVGVPAALCTACFRACASPRKSLLPDAPRLGPAVRTAHAAQRSKRLHRPLPALEDSLRARLGRKMDMRINTHYDSPDRGTPSSTRCADRAKASSA